MRLRTRMVLLVGISVGIGIVTIAVFLTWLSWLAIRGQAETQGQVIARLLARSLTVAERVVTDVDSMLDRELTAQGVLTSHLADLADQAGVSDQALGRRLAEIAARSTIDEIWVTNAAGRTRATSAGDADPDVDATTAIGLRAGSLDRLLAGNEFAERIGIGQQALGGTPMHYIGVRGTDSARAVLIGREQRHIAELADTLGIPRLLESLPSANMIEAVWVFDGDARALAQVAMRDAADPMTARESDLVRASLAGLASSAILSPGWISVAAAMTDAYGTPSGATLVRLSTAPFRALLMTYLRVGGLISLGVLVAGVGVSVIASNRMAAPVLRIAGAAEQVDAHRFTLGSLATVARRRDELGHLARTFETMAEQVMTREEYLERQVALRTAELVAKNEQLDQAHRQLAADLELARLLQATILPQRFPPDRGWIGCAMMTPALRMAGDFYDHFALDEFRTGLVIADVSGKGVAPAFFMAVSRAALQDAAARHGDPGRALAEANERLCGQNPLDMFVTVFYAVIDSRDGRIVYANGGHNPPYLVSPDGTVTALPRTGGMMLGIMPGISFDSAHLVAHPGDTLFLFTDGVTEAMNPEQEEFGDDRLEAELTRDAGQPVELMLDGVTRAVHDFARGEPQSDDITCLVVRYTGPAAS